MNQELLSTVERTMKKYADNLMRFLEGISSRLSQLELYCYNLDKSIGEMRSDLGRDHGDSDAKLKSLEKHLQEVHRSVQILRDKQELAETQKELAKLQLAQKESSSSSHEERTAVSPPESKRTEDASDSPNTQLALALPSQVAPQPPHPTMQQQSVAPPQPPPSQPQLTSYYMSSTQLPNPQTQSQPSYLQADAQYRAPQLAPPPPQGPQPTQQPQTPQNQQFSQYQQQQWAPQVSQPMQPPQAAPMQQQSQIRAPTPQSSVYSPYMAGQPGNPPPPEAMSGSMPMQVPFPGLQQPGVNRAEAMQYGFGGTGRPVQSQPPPPHMKGGFPSQSGDGYPASGSHPPISSAGTYMVYDSEGGRPHHPPSQPPPHYSQGGGYPPANPNPPPPSSSGLMIRGPSPPQFVRNHPYNELIDKLVSMGYRGDHVVSVIQRLEDSGQPVDFNAVLDRLNGHSSGSSQRGGW